MLAYAALHRGRSVPGHPDFDQSMPVGDEYCRHLLHRRKVENSRAVIHAGLLYTLGRCLLYLGLATLLTTTAMSIPAVSVFLQKYMHLVLGPIFLLLGMFLVGLITVTPVGP